MKSLKIAIPVLAIIFAIGSAFTSKVVVGQCPQNLDGTYSTSVIKSSTFCPTPDDRPCCVVPANSILDEELITVAETFDGVREL